MELLELVLKALGQVWTTLLHNWPFLVVSILLAAGMKQYVNQDAIAGFLRRHEKGGILAATAAAVGTPLCSCGTTAVLLGMMAGTASGMPWAPIIAFMVASPLTSPEELFYSAGLFGWPFALAIFVASIVLGLAGGVIASVLEARGWLRNQARLAGTTPACGCGTAPVDRASEPLPAPALALAAVPMAAACGCGAPIQRQPVFAAFCDDTQVHSAGFDTVLPLFVVAPERSGCDPEAVAQQVTRADTAGARPPAFQWMPFLREVAVTGWRLLFLFLTFATAGYLINDLIPATWITSLFGRGHAYSVPLAATLGLPFYINSEASLPLVLGMLSSGMSSGAALAFLITGAGTSMGAIAGALTIARWRVIAVVIGTLWVGAIFCGLAYDALLAPALF